MASNDAPDWERVVTTVEAMGDVPDAPDWQRIVVGEGGAPVGGLTNPMTTKGDIIVGGTAGAPARLGVGSSTQFLGVTSGTPAWKAAPTGTVYALGLQGAMYTNNGGLGPNATFTAGTNYNEVLFGSQPLWVYTHNTITVDALVVINFTIFRISGGGGTGTELSYQVQDDSARVLSYGLIADTSVTWPIYNYSTTISLQLANTASAFALYFAASGSGTVAFDDFTSVPSGMWAAAAINGYYTPYVVA